jgi:HEAT repeat protein
MAAYAAMGRVTGAIGQHAEDVFVGLDEAAQKCFARVFYRLVNIDDQGTPTRRRCPRADATDGDPAAERLVSALIENRLLIAERDNIIEVAHEALLRSWGRLATWIETTADDIWWLQKVGAAAAEWERAERPERLLWDYEDLHLVYGAIERLGVAVEPLVAEFIRPQTDRLLAEFRTAPEYRQLSILDRLAEIGADAAGALVAGLAAAKGEAVRAGIDAILWTMPEAAARELIAVLGRRETNLRRAAADAAGRLGVVSTVPALVENLRDPALNNKQPELKALALLADAATAPQVVPALIAMLRAERWEERALAADSLGALGALDGAGDLPALAAAGQALSKLVYDARGEVRQAAIRALGRVGAPTVVGLLLARLRDAQPNPQTAADREALIGALAAMGEVNGRNLLDESTRFRVRNALIEAASAPEDAVRAAAAEAFGKLRDNGVIAQLSFMLRDPESARVRETAASTIGALEHTHGVRPLLNTLTDASPLVRTAAVRALGAFKGRDDIRAPLRALLFNDADARPRAEAALVLGAARDSNATDALTRALADKNITVQIAAIEALGMLKSVGATDSLVRIIKNKKVWGLRQAAATAIARIGTHQGRGSLVELAAGRDFDAALASAVALTILGHADESTIKALSEGLADPRPEVRRVAAEAFGALKHRPAAEDVLKLLRDPDADVRAAASEALGQIAELGVIPALRDLVGSPLLGVSRAASRALATLEARSPQAASPVEGLPT